MMQGPNRFILILAALLCCSALSGRLLSAEAAGEPSDAFEHGQGSARPDESPPQRRYPRLRYASVISALPLRFGPTDPLHDLPSAHASALTSPGAAQDPLVYDADRIPALLAAASLAASATDPTSRRAVHRVAAVSAPKPALRGDRQKADSSSVENSRLVVMLDPGHGGIDPGARAHNGLVEKILTLDIALRIRRQLADDPSIEVRLTRDDDTGLSRHERVARVRDGDADLLVSLHFNHLPQQHVTLVETFFASDQDIADSRARLGALAKPIPVSAHSASGSSQLAKLLHHEVYDAVQAANPNAIDAGIKNDMLFILTQSATPGALMELSCISNEEEAERLRRPAYREKIAGAITRGIRGYGRSLHTAQFDTRGLRSL